MMYRSIRTMSDLKYNFRIFKLVHFLHATEVIDTLELAEHVAVIELLRPVGLRIDYGSLQYMEVDGRMVKI